MELSLDKVAIIYNPEIEGAQALSKSIRCTFESSRIHTLDNMPDDATFVIVIGGGGTLLKSARKKCESDGALFCFFKGRLGFLVQGLPGEKNRGVS